MPIVFVHGVNNRDSAMYRAAEVARNGFLREVIGPVLSLSPDLLLIDNPYWGGSAAKFAWNMSVLPDAETSDEAFGADGALLGMVAEFSAGVPDPSSIVLSAKKDLAATVDAVYEAGLMAAKTEEESRCIARSYMLAADYADNNTQPSWLGDANDDTQFLNLLVYNIHLAKDQDQEEAFGGSAILDRLREGASRLIHKVPDALAGAAWRLKRKDINDSVARFAGDAFVYLKERGGKETPGPVVACVLKALRAAESNKTEGDDKLVVVAHSFGGEIVYDIATTFALDLRIDCLITVGSQVGLFEEMKLYVASQADVPPDPPEGRLRKPLNIKHWLNVYDANDVLSFRVTPVFADTHDYHYDTGYGTLRAHGGYFMRPSFYRRLAKRLNRVLSEKSP